jgi:hypothetical protein
MQRLEQLRDEGREKQLIALLEGGHTWTQNHGTIMHALVFWEPYPFLECHES